MKRLKLFVILVAILSITFTSTYSAEAAIKKANFSKAASSNAKFQPYKALVTAKSLNIRRTASLRGEIIGRYYKGQVIEITGSSGNYLKTSRGYVSAFYTKKYTQKVSAPQQSVNNTGKFIRVNEDTPIYLSPGGPADERYALKGKTYKIFGNSHGYYKVKQGKIYGFIPSSKTSIISYTPKDKISLAWQYIYQKDSNKAYYNDGNDYVNIKSTKLGINILSPTWFYIDGDYKNMSTIGVREKADREYVRIAHRNGYEVWGLVSEFDGDRAYAMFTNAGVRQEVIDNIIKYAASYNLDGINIDFEAIGHKNKDLFTRFVRDLRLKLKPMGITVSVDITKPENSTSNVWSAGYDRQALSAVSDYIMFMAYDEHYSGSTKAGSVGSFPWVDEGIRDILNQGVPREKLILGVPFYLRDFTMSNENPSIAASSKSVSIGEAMMNIKNHGGSIYYDKASKQNVGQYYKDGYKHLLWIEDASSMSWRMDLINKYGLKGMAAWSLNWNPSQNILKTIKAKLN